MNQLCTNRSAYASRAPLGRTCHDFFTLSHYFFIFAVRLPLQFEEDSPCTLCTCASHLCCSAAICMPLPVDLQPRLPSLGLQSLPLDEDSPLHTAQLCLTFDAHQCYAYHSCGLTAMPASHSEWARSQCDLKRKVHAHCALVPHTFADQPRYACHFLWANSQPCHSLWGLQPLQHNTIKQN